MPKRKRDDEESSQVQNPNPVCDDFGANSIRYPTASDSFNSARFRVIFHFHSRRSTSHPFDASERRKAIVGNVMKALADSNTHLIGVYGSYDLIIDTLIERVSRRNGRDNLFDRVLTVPVTKKPDVKEIQDQLARQLDVTFNRKSKDGRAKELIDRIKNEQKILIVLSDLYKKLDLGKVGIPYGAEHTGCKILLTSETEDVLSNHMHTQKNFMVG